MLSTNNINKCPSIFQNTFSKPILIEHILLIIYIIIFFVGLVGNIMTIMIIKYNTHLRTPTNFYLLNLAVSDLMILMCNLPLEIIEIYYRQWPLSIIFCILRNVCAEFFTCSSILTILAFTCERYFAIVHPIHFHQLSHLRRAQSVILIIWLISLIFSVPFGLFYEIETNKFSIPVTKKLVSMNETIDYQTIHCSSCVPKKTVSKLLSIIVTITSFCLFYFPMVIIGTIYLFIGKTLRRVNKYENNSEYIQSSLSSLTNYESNGRNQILMKSTSENTLQTTHIGSVSWLKSRARCQARKVVIKTLVAVVIGFCVCYAPLYLQRLLLAIMTLSQKLDSASDTFSNVLAYLYIISGATFYLGSVINPILYNVVSNKYRRAFRDLIYCRLVYKKKQNVKIQRKSYSPNRNGSQQPIQYFVVNQNRIEMQRQQKRKECSLNKISCLDSDQQQYQNYGLTKSLPVLKHPILVNNQLSRSNSSSISSRNVERHQMRSHHSDASLSRNVKYTNIRQFS